MLVPEASGKVKLCLDPAKLDKALRPVQRGLKPNKILLILVFVKYLILIEVSSGYHNLKLDDKLYLTAFPCPFGRHQYVKLPFGASQAQDIFQKKIDELFSSMKNVFVLVDDILILGFDEWSKHYDEMLEKVI